MNEIPQSCSLTAPEMEERREAFAKLPLIGERVEGGATLLSYRDEPGVEAALRELVRLEAECCPGIALELSAGDGEVVLRIAG
jgi:hypothetical protein